MVTLGGIFFLREKYQIETYTDPQLVDISLPEVGWEKISKYGSFMGRGRGNILLSRVADPGVLFGSGTTGRSGSGLKIAKVI